MAYTTEKLVTNAYYESGIVSREFEGVTGPQAAAGLEFLNDLIGDKTIDSSLIPYTDRLNFPAVVGQQEYFIENLIYIETFTFFIQSVRYATQNQQRSKYFGSFRPTNVQSLPFAWHTERCFGGSNLFLFFLPDQNYPLEIWGQFRLAEVTQFQDLSLTLDRFYINFLKFELAVRLCAEFSYSVPPMVQKQLNSYYQQISAKANTMDLSMKKISTLTRGGYVDYAQVNLGHGWSTI
jgi:hypothetical protein